MQKLSQPLLMTLEENRAALKASESRTYQPNGTREQERRRRQRERKEQKKMALTSTNSTNQGD